MQAFRFGPTTIDADDPRLAAALAGTYGDKRRPLCDCTADGVPMYVAHVGDRYLIKRMPNCGSQHHPECESYEPPAELSGLGEVAGAAIQEDVESGITTLKLDFSLSKGAHRNAPVANGGEAQSVRTDGSKLTLRGTLHYLWDQAGLNRWSPAMAGKRSWFVVRKHLLRAADNKVAKGSALGATLFIPEQFSVERKDEITERRLAKLARIWAPAQGTRKLMLLAGEVKQIERARYGHKLVVKHLPDMPLMLADDTHKRMNKRFANDLSLWNADESTHLVVGATFGFSAVGTAEVEELALIVVSGHWIPIEHLQDLQLLTALTHAGRRFSKGLRYNLAGDRPLAAAVLSDTVPHPVALYVVPPNASAEYRRALGDLINESELSPWVWMAGERAMPELPAYTDYVPHADTSLSLAEVQTGAAGH
jgi:hypothetical protein